MTSITIRPATAGDTPAIETLHRTAFGEAGDKIVALLAALHDAPATLPPIAMVAVENDAVIGHVHLSAARLDAPARLVDVLTLSPLAVLPTHRRQGIAASLISRALAEADSRHVPLVFLEGDPRFYARRGFDPAGPLGFRRPSLRIPEPAFQVARLSAYQPWMTGTFVYSDPFWATDCVGLR